MRDALPLEAPGGLDYAWRSKRLAAAPSVKLSEEQVTEEGASQDKPDDDTTNENDQADLSLAEKEEVVHLTLYGNKSEAEAIAEVRAKRETA